MTKYDAVTNIRNKTVRKAQERIILTLLPDTCSIMPSIDPSSRSVSRYGITTADNADLRTYNGSTSIPCRADAQSSFRPEELSNQASQVDEFNLHLPYDMTIEETDIITVGGHEYKVRKLIDDSEWDFTKVVKLMRATTDGINP